MITGGTGVYTYQWMEGPATKDRFGLSGGSYSVDITDASECATSRQTFNRVIVLTQPSSEWGMNGNSNTDPSTQFIGTLDNYGLAFRTNNNTRMFINANGNVGIGTSNPTEKLTVGGNMKVDGKIITNRITTLDSLLYFGDSTLVFDKFRNRIYSDGTGFYHGANYKGMGIGSGAFGYELYSIGIGFAQAMAEKSIAIGNSVLVNSQGSGSIVIGSGALQTSSSIVNTKLLNAIPNSLMIGMNSNIPTIFVSPSAGINTTGKVGIGTSDPTQKFEVSGGNILIKGVDNFTEPENDATLYLGDVNHYIRSIWGKGLRIGTFGAADAIFLQETTGNVGIGTLLTTNPNNYKLAVNGTIGAREVNVEIDKPVETWPDFVFVKDYKLTPLEEVEKYISEHKHLPEIPSAEDIAKKGVALGETQALLLEKIEELTLYVIELNKQVEQLKKENELKKN